MHALCPALRCSDSCADGHCGQDYGYLVCRTRVYELFFEGDDNTEAGAARHAENVE